MTEQELTAFERDTDEIAPKITEDARVFGDMYVYCTQHLNAHPTGWCSVSVRDKIGLGVNTAAEAYQKCREFGLKLHHDKEGK